MRIWAAGVTLLALLAFCGGAGARQSDYSIAISEKQAELDSGVTDVTLDFNTQPGQPDAAYAITLVDPQGHRTAQHGVLDAQGAGTTVFQISKRGRYRVIVDVVGGVTTTGSLQFDGQVIPFPVYFIYGGSEPGPVLHSVSGRSEKRKRITPYHGNIGGFVDPTAFADATGTVDPPDRGCKALNYHGSLFKKHDPAPAHCGWGKAIVGSDTGFPLFFLGTAITRELWAKEYLAKGAGDLRDVNIGIQRERLILDQFDTTQRNGDLPGVAKIIVDRLQAADKRNVAAFTAVQNISRGRGTAHDKEVAKESLTAAVDHMQYVIELLPKHHLLHRSEVPEFVVSIDGGFMPAIDRSDLCVRISSTAAPGTKILLEIDKPGGTHEERTVAIAQNGRVVTHVNSLTTGGNTTDVRVYAFGADTIGASFKGYMNAPSGC